MRYSNDFGRIGRFAPSALDLDSEPPHAQAHTGLARVALATGHMPDRELILRLIQARMAGQDRSAADADMDMNVDTDTDTDTDMDMAAHHPTRVPLEPILALIHAHPGMVEHLEGIDLDGDGIPDLPAGPPPSDPAGRAWWREMTARRQQALTQAQTRRAGRKQHNNQVVLATLKARDPLFDRVYSRLDSYVDSLPGKVKRMYLDSIERTPGAFLELYAHLREHLIAEVRNIQAMARTQGQEGGGESGPERVLVYASPADELADLKARSRAGKAGENDLLRYIQLSMGDSQN